MSPLLFIFTFIPLIFSQVPKIAIIGGGISGASLSHFLSEKFSEIEITIFEKNIEAGGRTNHFLYDNKTIEMGASFFITENKNIIDLAEKYNVKYSSKKDKETNKEIVGLWDSADFKFKTSENFYFTMLKMLWRYGLTPLTLKYEVSDWITNFLKIYENESSFENYEEFLKIIKAENSTNKNFVEHLKEKKYNEDYINEMVAGAVSGIYNQNYLEIQSLAGFISMAAVYSKPYSFDQGNRDFIKKIISGNKNVKLITDSQIVLVKKWENGKFSIDSTTKNKKSAVYSDFDLVIFAAPIQNVDFKNISIDSKNILFSTYYQETHTTLVAGNLMCFYFSQNETECPGIMLATKQNKVIVTDYSRICQKCYKLYGKDYDIYKFQSVVKLTPGDMNLFFPDKYKIIDQKEWKAYPRLKMIKNEKIPDIQLSEGIYFVNGMESLASCMEMQTISAKNIAKLIEKNEGKHWKKKTIDNENKKNEL